MNIDKAIEFNKVKEIWKSLAVTEHAQEKIEKAEYILAELELKKALKDTTDAKAMIEKLGTPPLQNVTEIKDVMETAKKGECLTPYQLEKVGMILAAVRRLKDYLERGKMYENPLAYYEENLDAVDELGEEIARHPLMDKSVNVPLQFELGGDISGIVITGPNTGGKTVAIKTVMLNCLMAQCGLHVTCEKAEICMNSSYLCDIGDGQNLSENLSTFSAHIKNVLDVLGKVNRDSLVIMDELGSGTDPAEGMGIAIAILEELRNSGCNFIVTTHYPEVKEYAKEADGIVNARMTFDKDTLLPTYQMIIGEAGESCAFYIADRLGMPEGMLKTAIKAAYGEKAAEDFVTQNSNILRKQKTGAIKKIKNTAGTMELTEQYNIGDSVMIYPDKKIGIVCEKVNDKGVLRVQIQGKKIWINQKRVKLQVAASELYPEDYDFSIIFESVQNRKIKHDMGRKYTEEKIVYEKE